MAGSFLEFFDFLTYAYFATYIGKAFFPTTDPLTSILLAFATFGVGFLMRPIGAIIIGAYGDKKGRKPAMVLTLLLMAIGTLLVGLMPDYATLGVMAPILVVTARSLQGLSAGGEWGGATSFLVEYAPEGKRGFYGSLQLFSVNGGLLAGSLFGVGLSALLSTDQLASWGWRIPFLFGGLIAPVGLYLRARISDTPEFEAVRRRGSVERTPIIRTFSENWRRIGIAFCFTMGLTVSSYVFQIYLPTFLVRELKFTFGVALLASSVAQATSLILTPLAGYISDQIGRKPLLFIATIGHIIAAYPMFWLLVHYPTLPMALCVMLFEIVLFSLYCAPAPSVLCELFPTRVRVTSVSIGYNVAVTIFGGFAPFIATYLISVTGTPLAPAFYVAVGSIVGLLAVLSIHDRYRERLLQ